MPISDQELLQINQALFSLTHAYESRMLKENPPEKTGMTLFDCAVLMVIGQHNPIRSIDLAKLMDVERSTISIYVKRLTKKGLIHLGRDDEDHRVWWIKLNPAGQIAYHRIINGTVSYTHDFISTLNDEEAITFHRLLQKLSHSLGFTWQ